MTEPKEPRRVEWLGRAAFAEAAEALGVSTTEIMAAMPVGRSFAVLYTPGIDAEDEDWDGPIYRAILRRDKKGVPVVVSQQQAGTLAEWKAKLEAHMLGLDLGEPPGDD